jgi:hypothetical protein
METSVEMLIYYIWLCKQNEKVDNGSALESQFNSRAGIRTSSRSLKSNITDKP